MCRAYNYDTRECLLAEGVQPAIVVEELQNFISEQKDAGLVCELLISTKVLEDSIEQKKVLFKVESEGILIKIKFL